MDSSSEGRTRVRGRQWKEKQQREEGSERRAERGEVSERKKYELR